MKMINGNLKILRQSNTSLVSILVLTLYFPLLICPATLNAENSSLKGNSSLSKTTKSNVNNGGSSQGWLGVVVQSLTKELADGLGIKDYSGMGALIADVVPESPAAEAGLKPADVVVSFDSKVVEDDKKFVSLIGDTEAGKLVKIEIIRQGKRQIVQTQLGELKNK